jgi:twitching motility protein PilT
MADIDVLFNMFVRAGASDLHLSPRRRPMIRVDGRMVPMDLPVVEPGEIEKLLAEIMPEVNANEFRERNDTDFAYEVPGLARLRANVYRDRFGMGAVFRVIPTKILTAEQLDLPPGVINLCHLSKGLVVVTGPTGSGKSTTLAAMVDLVNRTRQEHIITIEDPIEFVHDDKQCVITQREIRTHTDSFASALRAALRQDPDVVLVGEMRDLETIEIAIETAETGHLVFGTLHTNTAYSTINRIIDAFPSGRQNQVRSMLASSLKGAISQTLCRKIGGGRVAALEILLVDSGVAAMIREGKIHQIPSLMQVGRGRGMVMLNESLADLVAAEVVEPFEGYLKAIDKDDIVNRFDKAGIPFDLNAGNANE